MEKGKKYGNRTEKINIPRYGLEAQELGKKITECASIKEIDKLVKENARKIKKFSEAEKLYIQEIIDESIGKLVNEIYNDAKTIFTSREETPRASMEEIK